MMKLWLAICLLVADVCRGDILRISEVVAAAGEEAESMKLAVEGRPVEELFVSKRTIISDKDVRSAFATRDGIQVELNDAGATKLSEATAKMAHGRQRLALIVEGRLVSAPVIQSQLGGHFQISGLDGLGRKPLDDIARRMSGLPIRPDNEIPPPSPEPEPVPRVPYTEEEYQQIKVSRESVGIRYLEKVPDQAELEKVLQRGMDRAQVIKLFGEPWSSDPEFLRYSLAPEKRPDNSGRETYREGFHVRIENGKVATWGSSWSDAPREEKVLGRQAGILPAVMPRVDFSPEKFVDSIALLEGIKVQDARNAEANRTDLEDLSSVVIMLASVAKKGVEGESGIDPGCDLIVVLARYMPEVAKLRDSTREQAKIPLNDLKKAVEAYLNRSGDQSKPQGD